MTVTVQIPTALRRLTSGTGQVKCSATNLGNYSPRSTCSSRS
jgi:hypothetical protein